MAALTDLRLMVEHDGRTNDLTNACNRWNEDNEGNVCYDECKEEGYDEGVDMSAAESALEVVVLCFVSTTIVVLAVEGCSRSCQDRGAAYQAGTEKAEPSGSSSTAVHAQANPTPMSLTQKRDAAAVRAVAAHMPVVSTELDVGMDLG